MTVAAAIWFAQPGGAGNSAPGFSLLGVDNETVTVHNGDDTNVENWSFEIIDVPPTSTIPKGVVQDGTMPTYVFLPDVPGGYLFHIVVTDQFDNIAEDWRIFQVSEPSGRIIPPFRATDAMLNFIIPPAVTPNTRGWAPLQEAYNRLIDSGVPIVVKNGGTTLAGGPFTSLNMGANLVATAGGGGSANLAASGGGGGGGILAPGPYSSRPGPSTAGRVYICTDVQYLYVDTGSAWLQFGPIQSLPAPPVASAFATVNPNADFTLVAEGDGLFLNNATGTLTAVLRMFNVAVPAAPYTVKIALQLVTSAGSGVGFGNIGTAPQVGICLHDTGSGDTLQYSAYQGAPMISGTTIYLPAIVQAQWSGNGATRGGGPPNAPCATLQDGPMIWLRIQDDGANRTYSHSSNNADWALDLSEASGNYITPTHAGICSVADGQNVAATIASFTVTSP